MLDKTEADVATITVPAKPTGLRGVNQDGLDATYINNVTTNRTAYPISGTCTGAHAEGGTVILQLDGTALTTTPATVKCTSGERSLT